MEGQRLEALEQELRALRAEARRSARRVRAAWALALSVSLAAVAGLQFQPAEAQGGPQMGGVPALEKRLATVEAQQGADAALIAELHEALVSEAAARAAMGAALQAAITALDETVQPFFSYVTVEGTDVIFTGANLHLRNGLGATNGNPLEPLWQYDPAVTAVNGLGNLIIGYNEIDSFSGAERTGSHNLVIGPANDYTSFAGVVSGVGGHVSAPFAAIAGGIGNVAAGLGAAVTGGQRNEATGYGSTVSGGGWNTASDVFASVSGGYSNTASGRESWVGGGNQNVAAGTSAAVTGGQWNEATGSISTVTGGLRNVAEGSSSSISGGDSLLVPHWRGWAAGGTYWPNSGPGVFHSP
jgi:trimeric autotransporter adhesin